MAAYENTPKVTKFGANGRPLIEDTYYFHYLGGIDLVGRALLEGSDAAALAQGLRYYEAVIARHPGGFGFVYNNAALAARDLGAAYDAAARRAGTDDNERQRQMQRAMELWEKSYAYYEKAVVLEPNDPRIVNDCGLMLVYHCTATTTGRASSSTVPSPSASRR